MILLLGHRNDVDIPDDQLCTRGSQEITEMTNQQCPCLVLVILKQRTEHGQVRKANTGIYLDKTQKIIAANKHIRSTIDSFNTHQSKTLEYKKHASMYVLLETKT
jgi:hypothetical protein